MLTNMYRKHKCAIQPSKVKLIWIFIMALPFSWASIAVGSIYRIVTLILFTLYLINSKLLVHISTNKRKILIIWVLYIGYSIITMFWSTNFSAAVTNSMSLVLLSLIVLVFFATDLYDEDETNIDKCWILSGIICAVIYIFGDRTSIGEYGSRTSMTILGTPTDPNEFASIFIVPISLALYELLHKRGSRLLQALFIIGALYCVFMTGSRGALLAVVVAMLVTAVQNVKISVKAIIITAVIGFLSIAVFMRYIFPLIPDDVLTRLSIKAILEDGGSGRGDVWIDAFRKIWSGSVLRMIFGYGQYGLTVGTQGVTQTMHNQFIQQLSNYGFIGLILYCMLIYRTYAVIRKKCKRYVGAFWGMMVMSLTITMSGAYKPLWILMLMPVIMASNTEEHTINYGK